MIDEEGTKKKGKKPGCKEIPLEQYVIDAVHEVKEMKKELADPNSSSTKNSINNRKSAKMNRVKFRIKKDELEGHVQDPKENTKKVM